MISLLADFGLPGNEFVEATFGDKNFLNKQTAPDHEAQPLCHVSRARDGNATARPHQAKTLPCRRLALREHGALRGRQHKNGIWAWANRQYRWWSERNGCAFGRHVLPRIRSLIG